MPASRSIVGHQLNAVSTYVGGILGRAPVGGQDSPALEIQIYPGASAGCPSLPGKMPQPTASHAQSHHLFTKRLLCLLLPVCVHHGNTQNTTTWDLP